jgi:hypothetical protein
MDRRIIGQIYHKKGELGGFLFERQVTVGSRQKAVGSRESTAPSKKVITKTSQITINTHPALGHPQLLKPFKPLKPLKPFKPFKPCFTHLLP